jgi:hypothetical protein
MQPRAGISSGVRPAKSCQYSSLTLTPDTTARIEKSQMIGYGRTFAYKPFTSLLDSWMIQRALHLSFLSAAFIFIRNLACIELPTFYTWCSGWRRLTKWKSGCACKI